VHYKNNKANAAPATVIESKIYFMPLFLTEWEGVDCGYISSHQPGDLPEIGQEIH